MVANDPTLNIEGAGLFAHAFSTHACDNDLDFWTAVDDDPSVRGSANMGHAEFNAACYYRFIALNLDLLADPEHLESIGKEGRQRVVRTFLRAVLLAVPTAKQNSFNGHSLPEFALGVVSSGQPFQLANAFEAPVQPRGKGWLQPSVKTLENHLSRLKEVYSLEKFDEGGNTRSGASIIKDEVRLSLLEQCGDTADAETKADDTSKGKRNGKDSITIDTFIERLVSYVV